MSHDSYEPAIEYDEYPDYPSQGMTSLGLTTGQLALIIGVNAVISLLISVSVVLAINWQNTPAVVTDLPPTEPPAEAGTPVPTIVEMAESQPTEAPALESVIYQVQGGDTLSGIAEQFNIPVFDLMVANNLTSDDFIQVGQKLIIPLAGLPTATPTFTPVPPTPTETIAFEPPTPLPTDEVTESLAVIATPSALTAAQAITPTVALSPPPESIVSTGVSIVDVVGVGDLAQEMLMVSNLGTGISLKDWTLEGSPLGIFVFPDIFLFPGGTIRVHTAAGQNTPSDLYLNQSGSAWPLNSTVLLKDNNGTTVSQFIVVE